MYSFARVFVVLVTLLASVTLAVPVRTERSRTPALARSRSPSRTLGKQKAPPAPILASKVNKINVNGVSYILDKRLGAGVVGTVYSTTNDKVAKMFRTAYPNSKDTAEWQQRVFLKEEENTRRVLGVNKMNSGKSRINDRSRDEEFSWIITARIHGEFFFKTPEYSLQWAKGWRACSEYIEKVVQPEFKKELVGLYQRSGLVHLDAHQRNTFWDEKGHKIVGFVDYDQMDVVGGFSYNARVMEVFSKLWPERVTGLAGALQQLNMEQFATLHAEAYFRPIEMCNPRGKYNPPSPSQQ